MKKSVDLFVWVRLGDACEYEKHDDVSSAAAVLHEASVKGPLRQGNRGQVFADGFEAENYISLFWGDDEGDFVKNLTKGEIKMIEQEIGE